LNISAKFHQNRSLLILSYTVSKLARFFRDSVEFGKPHDTTDATDFCPRQLVAGKLRGIWL